MMFLCFVVLAVSVDLSTQCFNENGEDRDWFIMLKMPGVLDYIYADNTHNELMDTLTGIHLNNQNNPVARVLNLMYIERQNYILYNDQPPGGNDHQNRGHTKGAVVWQEEGTVRWLIHSVPRFPPDPQEGTGYRYPDSRPSNGQSFMCIKADYGALGAILNSLFYTWPWIYARNAPDVNQANFPDHWRVINGDHQRNTQDNTNLQFIGPRGEFIVFSETGSFARDIYKDWMALYFQRNYNPRRYRLQMFVETWRNGAGTRMPSDCTGGTDVFNVNRIQFNLVYHNYFYVTTTDHSKWAVTNTGFVCVGDINRMVSQTKRGGSSVCLWVPLLQEQIRDSIIYDQCRANEESGNYEEWEKNAANTMGNAHKFGFKFALLCALYLLT